MLPGDLVLFQRYWVSQFPNLLNDRGMTQRRQVPTKIGLAFERALQIRSSPRVPPSGTRVTLRLPDILQGR